MLLQVSVFIAISLDGFIARPDGDIGWLEAAGDAAAELPPDEDFGNAAFMATVDCIVMGRNTFEKVQSFGEWPYEGKRLVVLSTTLEAPPPGYEERIELHAGPITDLLESLAADGCKRIYADGGKTIQSFLREGLIHDLTLTVIPVLLGGGLPLFGDLAGDIPLRLVSSAGFPNGFVQLVYHVS